MTNAVDKNGTLLPPEERVTKFGCFVRAASLDELLQFWNILKGEMSFIGPRPLLKEYLDIYTPFEMMRHAVRPGLECPAPKPLGHYWTWKERFDNDIWYVENVCLKTDILLFFRIIQSAFNRNNMKIRSVSAADMVDMTMQDRLKAGIKNEDGSMSQQVAI